MNKNSYISFNGETIKKEEFSLGINNRAFLYGDALFETFIASGTRVVSFKQHLNRLKNSMEVLKMNIPTDFRTSMFGDKISELESNIIDLINKNRLFKGIRIRMTVFRKPGGLYTPLTNDVDYLIETTELDHDTYQYNKKGLIVDTFPDINKPVNKLSGIKSTNALLFSMAGIYRTGRKLDDCIIMNEQGHVCECMSSNIFVIKNKQLYTPSLSSGCVKGTMRERVIEIALDNGLTVFEDCYLTEQNLIDADEIFLTNAVSGIRWVLGFKKKRYLNNITTILQAELVKLQTMLKFDN